jgi:putative hydrolase of the HAD superfamily
VRRPRAILFDLGGTLLEETSLDVVAGAAALLAVAQNPRQVTLDDVREAADAIQRDVRPRAESSLLEHAVAGFHRLLFDRLGLTFDGPPHELALVFWKAAVVMTPEAGVADALRALGRIRRGVVSNSKTGEHALRWELAQHGLLDAFEFVIASAEYGVRKPSPLLFHAALGRLDLPAHEVWFIGDSIENDIAGARGVGMTPVLYDRSGTVPYDGLRLSSWSELPSLLG